MAELEALGRRQLERIETVLANGSPNLPSLLLRLGDDPLAATADYSEGYRLLDGELFPYYAGRDDDLIADPATLSGATAAYELEEAFQRGEEPAPGDYYFLNRLYTFPDENTATEFMASRPEVLATGGFALVSDAAPEARSDLLPGEATDLGDESLAFSFVAPSRRVPVRRLRSLCPRGGDRRCGLVGRTARHGVTAGDGARRRPGGLPGSRRLP